MFGWYFNVKCTHDKRWLVCFLFQGPAGPTGTPGVRGEDGNPGPRVREIILLLENIFAEDTT